MYLPKQFEAPSHAMTVEVMQSHNFATLVTADDAGAPMATHLPVVVKDIDGKLELHFHLARANPHVPLLRSGRRTMLAFMGPHAYMSPSVYPDLKRVPTWNYLAVHAYGPLTEIEDAEGKDALLKSLIAIHEPPYAQQWIDLDPGFQTSLLGAIAAFRMDVDRIDSKFKLNQHRKESHAAMKAGYAVGTPHERALGQWMERLGL